MRKSLRFQNTELLYTVLGKGPAVVLLHGFSEDHHIWDEQTRDLTRNFQVILPDLPGSGESPYNDWYLSMDHFAESIKCILDKEGISCCSMIGHSMGGYIGLAFASKYRDKLNGLGLFHSTAYPDTEEKKASREKSIAFIKTHGSAPFLEQSIPGLFSEAFKKEQPDRVQSIISQYSDFFPDSLILYYRAMIARPDRTDLLKNLNIPVLLILGDEDKAVPIQDGLKQSYLPKVCYIHIFKGVAHMGMIEKPAESNQILQNYLKEL